MEAKLATGCGFLIVELVRSSPSETSKELAARAGAPPRPAPPSPLWGGLRPPRIRSLPAHEGEGEGEGAPQPHGTPAPNAMQCNAWARMRSSDGDQDGAQEAIRRPRLRPRLPLTAPRRRAALRPSLSPL